MIAPDSLISHVFGEWPDNIHDIQAFEHYYFDDDSDLAMILAVEEAYEVKP
ncbi:hypothetical protein [Streptomyces sp. NPDC092295]|uniref:DUF7215 family protein n=1 Tax=Streptomyces sp. NPDC092295 TaxID=3366011 RepID=UPI003815C861